MGQRTNILLQIEGRCGARMNRVYHLQWGYRKYLPMAFLHMLSSRYFKPEKTDIFEFFSKSLDLDGITMLERDWSKYDFNKLEDCQEVLSHRDNNNGAMVVVVTEDTRDYVYPKYKLGFLLGPEDVEGESPFRGHPPRLQPPDGGDRPLPFDAGIGRKIAELRRSNRLQRHGRETPGRFRGLPEEPYGGGRYVRRHISGRDGQPVAVRQTGTDRPEQPIRTMQDERQVASFLHHESVPYLRRIRRRHGSPMRGRGRDAMRRRGWRPGYRRSSRSTAASRC